MALDLAQWRAFLVVADRGSLIKAAEVLHTDQPALSRSLRRMERLIGAPLFERSSTGMTLSDLGRRMHQPARDLVERADAIEAQAHAEARQSSGVLRVGAVDMYPLTSAIAEACRDLTVAGRPIVAEPVGLPWLGHPRALLARSIDIGFTMTVDGRHQDPRHLRSQPLWQETEAFALISDQHPLAAADPIDPRDLADDPLHLPDKTESPDVYSLVLELLADAGVPAPRRAPTADTMASVIAHIAAGNGWMLGTGTVARNVPAGVVAKPFEVILRHTLQFEIVWHVNTDPTVVGAFTARLQSALDRRS
jgi:DNA-binding transcriptional LysR family regulator